MSTSKHTPGPWKYWNGIILDHNGDMDEGKQVCIVSKYGEEHDANARLIAAAPEMLEALQNLYLHCAMIHTHWGDGCNQKESDAAIKAGKLAINKALGK